MLADADAAAAADAEGDLPDASALPLERSWVYWCKCNTRPWKLSCMQRMARIDTVESLWRVLNNVAAAALARTNLFFMQDGVVPLWEDNGDVFTRGGGCWSIVVRRMAWRQTCNEAVVALAGEHAFSDAIRGCCVVPVSASHCICKLWATKSKVADREALEAIFPGCGAARFKKFN